MLRAAMILVTLLLNLSLLAAAPGRLHAQETSAPGSTVVYITKTGKCYHRESCTYLKQSKIKTTLAEAKKKHLKPCKKCKPPQ
jgi:methylphosphotriester-DNA--protein-cysteine methyltransferase